MQISSISSPHDFGSKSPSSNHLPRNPKTNIQLILTQFKSVIKDLFLALEDNDAERVELRKVQLIGLWKEFYVDFVAYDDNLFVEVATMVSLSEVNPENRPNSRSEYSKILRDILGSDSLLLSDYYVALAVAYDNEGLLDQALENAGRALLIRVERNGVIHHKTAESHFILGSFYLKQQLFEEAKREIYSSRGIYCQLYDEKNVFVANCDFILGQIEQESFHYDRAYLCFYKSFFARCLLFGPQHQLTKLAENLAIACRQGGGGNGAVGAGVRWFCGVELKNRVRELQWNETNQTSCKYLVALFLSRLHDDTILTSDQLLTVLSAALKFYETNFASVSQSLAQSQSKSVVPTTAEEVMMILSVPTRPLPLAPNKEKEVVEVAPVAHSADKQQTFPVQDAVDNSITSPIESVKHESLTISAQPIPPAKEMPNKLKVTFTTETPPDSFPSIRDSSTKSANGRIAHETRTKGAKSTTSPKLAIPQTWRPIPINSPLRNGGIGGASFQSEKFHTLLNSATQGPRFVRNEKGELLMLKKCSMDLLLSYIRPKMLLFALFSWYIKGSVRHLIRLTDKRSSTVVSSTVVHPIGGAIGGPGGDPKAALNALFSKRQAPADEKEKGDATTSNAKDATASGNGKFAINCPRPPPIPKSWPPVPYEGEGDFGISTGSEKMDLARALSAAGGVSKPKYKLLHMPGLADIGGTFWEESPELSVLFEELFDDFEDEFNITAKKKKGTAVGKTPSAKSPKKLAQETVLDPQRAQNINIMLAKFGKRTVESIASAILDFDPASLGGGAISSLVQFVPTPEEVGKVEQFLKAKAAAKSTSPSPDEQKSTSPSASAAANGEGTPSKLGKAESYVLTMSKIPKLEKKLLLMSQILCSKETSQSIVTGGEALVAAVQEVKGSGRLKFILRSFLDLNNSVLKSNQNSNLLQGISLTAWRKLGQVKINSGETAQNYVIAKLLQHVPEALEIAHDFPSIDEARGVNLPRLSAELKKIDESIALLQELIEDENKSLSESKPSEVEASPSKALGNLTRFHQELSKYYEEAQKRLDLALNDFSDVCRYYGESYPPMDPELFFGEVSSLVRAIQAVTANSSSKNRRKAVST